MARSLLSVGIVAAVATLAPTQARAQQSDGCPEDCRVALPLLALRPAPAQAPPSPAGLVLTGAEMSRTSGIALITLGIAASLTSAIAFGVRIGTEYTKPSGAPLTYAQTRAIGLGGLIGGGIAIGAGDGLLSVGTDVIGRGEPYALRLTHAHELRNAGIALTSIGGVLTGAAAVLFISGGITFLATYGASGPACRSSDCGVFGQLGAAAALGAIGPTLVAGGLPLLVVGRRQSRAAYQSQVIIDSFGPRAMPNGGGVGLSGRF